MDPQLSQRQKPNTPPKNGHGSISQKGSSSSPPSKGWIRRYCSFTSIVIFLSLLYSYHFVKSFYTLFNPDIHVGGPEAGLGPLWGLRSQKIDVYVYYTMRDSTYSECNHEHLIWSVTQQDPYQSVTTTKNITITEKLHTKKRAGYYHVFVTQSGSPPCNKKASPNNKPTTTYDPQKVVYKVVRATSIAPCRTNTTRTLLSTTTSADNEMSAVKGKDCNFLKPRLMIKLVTDTNIYSPSTIPPDILHSLKFFGRSYQPNVWLDETWLVKNLLLPINGSVNHLPVEIIYQPSSLGMWRVLTVLDKALQMLDTLVGEESDEPENLRESITGTSPILLAVTAAVSILHLVIDILAFKNDFQFWHTRKSMVGLSVGAVKNQLIMDIVIFLYLYDQNSGWLILVPALFSVVIDFYKVYIAASLTGTGKYDEITHEADHVAMKWLLIVLIPCCVVYAIYSLLHDEYKSWWSWGIQSAASAVYGVGFALMTPQLYINYKLKSVAALPWKVFIYKACNTFIDDLFAFIIKMPNMHRVAAFRDDVIFVVYMYQRWLYPIDHSRPSDGFDDESQGATGPQAKADGKTD